MTGRADRSVSARWAALLTVLSLALVATLVIPGAVSARLFALLAVILPVALIGLGALAPPGVAGPLGVDRVERRRLPRGLGFALFVLLLLLEGSVAGVLLLNGTPRPALAGLPPATVIQLVGLWLLPLPLVALAYAFTFERSGITRDDLERLRHRVGNPPLDPDPEQNPTPDRTR